MNQSSDVERYMKEPGLLVDLCREVIAGLSEQSEGEMVAMKAQLREISRSIERLDKQKVPVPEVLRAEKMRLVSALSSNAEEAPLLADLLVGLEDLLKNLKQQSPSPSDSITIKTTAQQKPSPKTHRNVLRKLIIDGLVQLKGPVRKNDLYQLIEKNYAGKFLPGDFDFLPDGKRIAWQNYCDWEGTLMRKEGLLKTDSPRGVWELSEDYQ